MMLLSRDWDTLENVFRPAYTFIVSARLRAEAYELSKGPRDEWKQSRFEELMRSPACRESWFRKMMREPVRCCQEPSVRGGRCVNCGTWTEDDPCPVNQADNEG